MTQKLLTCHLFYSLLYKYIFKPRRTILFFQGLDKALFLCYDSIMKGGTMLKVLVICSIMDIITGFTKALENKNLSSKALKHGMVSKIFIVIVVGLTYILTPILGVNLTVLVITYYIVMESISILENVSDYLPIPKKLKNLLAQVEEDTDKEVN